VIIGVKLAGIDDPSLIITKLEELRIGIGTASAALAEAVINIRDHNSISPC
jgi:hypothetical protein